MRDYRPKHAQSNALSKADCNLLCMAPATISGRFNREVHNDLLLFCLALMKFYTHARQKL